VAVAATASLVALIFTSGATILAQARSIFLELESGSRTNVTQKTSSNASGGKYVQFSNGSDSTPAPDPEPEPDPDPDPDPGCSGTNCIDGVEKPGPHNTGPTNESALGPMYETLRIETPGTVIENVDMIGARIDIRASNVTVRNFRVDGGGTYYGVQVRKDLSNVVIENGEITNFSSAGVYCQSECTIRRTHIHDSSADGMKISATNGQSLIEKNFVTRLGMNEGSHADGNQSVSGNNLVFRYNNFFMPYPGTAAHDTLPRPPGVTAFRSNATFIIHDGTDNILIEKNWLVGGNYTIYGNEGTVVRNNVFGRDNADSPDITGGNGDGSKRLCNGPFDDWSGNIWTDGTPAKNNTTCP